ncbi:MAG: thioredoxin domain-containing protein [bacterium]|nr:thioredoxin domain-containing protein [bacterium]MDO8742718.1 thioredoxin domain-containing protein [bacterium]
MENNESSNKFLPVAVIVAGLLIAGAVLWSGSHPVAAPSGTGDAPKVDIKNVKTDGDPFIGKADAPITIAFWSDFQCPFCKKFEVETLPLIIKDYVDTGKAKVVFMDFAFLGNDSTTAGLYNRAVWKLYPNQYFAWRTAMYSAQDDEGDQGFGDAASIDKLTATVAGIDVAKVAADVKVNEASYKTEMESDKDDAKKASINATPAVIVGTRSIIGAYPYENFKTAIEEALK